MKKKEKILIGILLVLLVVVGSIYINVKFTNKGNVIQKQEISKGQLSQAAEENAYVSTQSHLSEVNAQNQELSDLNTQISETTVTADRLLKGYTAYKNGQIITGTMENRGAVSETLNAGGSYTIPAGFHNGSGKIIAKDLASQTQATATAHNISAGKTAWVNGVLVTGTGQDSKNYQAHAALAMLRGGYAWASYNVIGKSHLSFSLDTRATGDPGGSVAYYPSYDYLVLTNGNFGGNTIVTLTANGTTYIDASQYLAYCTSGYISFYLVVSSSNYGRVYVFDIDLH